MEPTQADKDRELSFAIINYLSASYRGKLAGYTLLGQLGHPSFEEPEIRVLQHFTDRIAEWLAGLVKGEILFCANWETPETFEAQNALSMLNKLKPELLEIAQEVTLFLQGKKQVDAVSAKWLFSMLTRSSYARDVYLRGFVMYGETFGKPNVVQDYNAMLARATQHNALIHQGIEIFREADFDLSKLGDGFIFTLMAGCEELPSVFRTHTQDINLLSSNYKGGISFENLDFDKDEASEWLLAGIAPEPAGYWRAYGFGPQDSLKWLTSFVNDPGEATAWQSAGQTADFIKPWKELGFSFEGAMLWIRAGYTAQIAKDHIDRGILEPPPEAE